MSAAPSVVIHVHSGSWPDDGAGGADLSSGPSSARKAGGAVAHFPRAAHAEVLARAQRDPYRIARAFPERWSAFVRAQFRSPMDAARHFAISERAARKWWSGEGGVNGSTLAVAVETIPGASAALFDGGEG